MKPFFLIIALLLTASFVSAQTNPATLAAQQAMQQAQQANQLAAQQAQESARQSMEASQRATENAMRAMQNTLSNSSSGIRQTCCFGTLPPKFSVKHGKYTAPITVRLTPQTRGSYIYYTTDGWTPTAASTRYRGPIVIDASTRLNAIAISPEGFRSAQVSVQYIIVGAPHAAAKPEEAAPASGELPTVDGQPFVPEGTPVKLVFASSLTSKTANVGDLVAFTLAEDLRMGNTLIARKGASATGTVAQVDRTGAAGIPGTLTVEVDSLQSEIGTIPLNGAVTKEGDARPPSAEVLIPAIGPLFILKRGTHAVITPGAVLTVTVAEDIPLPTGD